MLRPTAAVLPLLLLVATPVLGQDRALDTARLSAPGSVPAALQPADPVFSDFSDSIGSGDSGGVSVLKSALLAGAGGAVIGLGVALIQGDNYGRDIAIGAGAGLVVGGVLGLTHAYGDRRALPEDGRSSLERNPVNPKSSARTIGVAGRF
jgi:hypothetical protein